MSTAGERLCLMRKSKGLTQEELADMASINLRTLQRIENGETDPRSSTLKRICDVLQVDPGEIINAGKTENNGFLSVMHLSVIAIFFIPSGNIILPLILWLSKRDKITFADEQGINILNFQILWSILILVAGVLALSVTGGLLKLFYAMPVILIVNLIYPVIVSILVKRGNTRNFYPVVFRFIK